MKYYHYLIVVFLSFIISLIVGVFIREGYFASPEFIRKKVEVPDLVGKTDDFGALLLKSCMLKINVAGEEYTDETEKGRVFRQSPAPGSFEKSGRTVDVWVSKGPLGIVVPEMKGLPQEEASAVLEKNFLVLSATEEEASGEIDAGRVIFSKPAAGTAVLRNSGVILVISSGKKMTVVPKVTGKTLSQAQSIISKNSLQLGVIKKETNTDRPFDVILRQHPPAGKKVQQGSSITVVINAEAEE